jgi:methylthioxylose transferase
MTGAGRAAVPAAALAALAATAGLGLWWGRVAGYDLGLPYPPFVGGWDPRVSAWAIAAAIVLGAGAWLAPRALVLRPLPFAAALLALTLAARLALGASSTGTGQWSRVFDPDGFEGPNEYLPALSALRYGAGFFLDRFAELVPALPVHAAGHPPGLLLVMHTLGIGTPAALAALCIGAGALAAPLTYAVGRSLLDERGARIAGLLCALAPSMLLFGATSADAVYATLGLLAAWPLCSPRWGLRALGALLLAAASLFAWSLLGIGAWAALVALLRRGWRDALALSVLCGAVLLAVHGALAAATGFDPIGTLRATEQVYRFGIADRRPYAYWLLGSPAAFLLMLGVPIAWLALRALAARRELAVAVFAVIAFAAVAGFTKAEVERIWLFLAPLVCLAAAGALGPRQLRPVLALLGVQALAWEIAWNTVW